MHETVPTKFTRSASRPIIRVNADEQEQERAREDLMIFLGTIVRPGINPSTFDDDINLIDIGVMDSLAVIQIISYLEKNYDLDLQAGGIDPSDLGSVSGILSAIKRAKR